MRIALFADTKYTFVFIFVFVFFIFRCTLLAFYVFAYECGSTATSASVASAAAVIFVARFEASESPMRYVLKISFNAKILNVHLPAVCCLLRTGNRGSYCILLRRVGKRILV